MKRLLILGAAVALMTGCASVRSMLPSGPQDGSMGDQMISQAQETKSLGKNWKEGQRLVDKSKQLLAQSEELARKSRELRAEAEGLQAQGTSLIQTSESTYQMAFGEGAADPGLMQR